MKILRYVKTLVPIIFILSVIFQNINIYALTGSQFRPGRIIDDAIFTNKNAMSAQQIQQFLDVKVPVCDRYRPSTNPSYQPPWTCLKEYQENIDTGESNYGRFNADGSPYQVPNGKSAAQIIWDAAQMYNINPQSLIVLLQKEQSLVTDDWPWLIQYQKATGYLCPDTAPCDPALAGFANQIYGAAWQFRNDLNGIDTPGFWSPFGKGWNNIPYNPNSACGTKSVFIENQATAVLYKYTPYTPNAAALNNLYGTGDSCSSYGNRNFWRIFNDWFGSTLMPYAFKSADDATVYMYVSGYKIPVPNMATLQDFGISPESIQTLNDTYISSLLVPDGISVSNQLSYLVKSSSDEDNDGGTVYLISVGEKHPFNSLAQFYEFGFSENNISKLPLEYIASIPGTTELSNFTKTPLGQVFHHQGGIKHLIFDYQTYITLNPLDKTTFISQYIADQTVSGAPSIDNLALIKTINSNAIYLFDSQNYFSLPDYDTYKCWGLDKQLIPLYVPATQNSISEIIPSDQLHCSVNDSENDYFLSEGTRIIIPSEFGITITNNYSERIKAFALSRPLQSSVLNRFVKTSSSAGVWYLENGKKRPIPTYANLLLLTNNQPSINIINNSILESIPTSKIKLGSGMNIVSDISAAVYAVYDNKLIPYPSSTTFVRYNNSWSTIEQYKIEDLDPEYSIDRSVHNIYFVDKSTNKTFLIDTECYEITNEISSAYFLDQALLSNEQQYDISAFSKLGINSCKKASKFIKSSTNATVYLIENGGKRPIINWQTLISLAGTSSPYIVTLSGSMVDEFPTGSPVN